MRELTPEYFIIIFTSEKEILARVAIQQQFNLYTARKYIGRSLQHCNTRHYWGLPDHLK